MKHCLRPTLQTLIVTSPILIYVRKIKYEKILKLKSFSPKIMVRHKSQVLQLIEKSLNKSDSCRVWHGLRGAILKNKKNFNKLLAF